MNLFFLALAKVTGLSVDLTDMGVNPKSNTHQEDGHL